MSSKAGAAHSKSPPLLVATGLLLWSSPCPSAQGPTCDRWTPNEFFLPVFVLGPHSQDSLFPPWPVDVFPAVRGLARMQPWRGGAGCVRGSSCRALLPEQIPGHMTEFSLVASYFGPHFPFLENGDV